MTEHEALGSAEERTLSLEEKRLFVLSAVSELAQYTFPYLCSIIGIEDQTTGRHVGSGLRCTLKGRRAVVTAWHVLEEARVSSRGFAVSTGQGEAPYVVQGKVNIDPVADLGVYFLPDEYPTSKGRFWPAERLDRTLDKLATDYLFLHGFPGSHSRFLRHFEGVISRSLPYGAMQRLDGLPSDLQPFQFAIEYDPAGMVAPSGEPQEPVDPHGLSGSPVWRIGVSGRSKRDWTPDHCLLVGVVTQWRPDYKVLVATSAAKIPPSW